MARDRDDRDDRDEDDDRPRRRPRRDDYEDDERDRLPPRTTSPGTSKAAGVIWIITGALATIITLLGVVQMVLSLEGRGPDGPMICGLLIWLTLALFGLLAGIRTVAGTSSEPIVNGVVSLLLALLISVLSVVLFAQGAGARGGLFGRAFGELMMILAVAFLLYGLLLGLAGVLVLAGRNEYVRFRDYKRAQRRAAEDRYRDDDRPRRRRQDDDRDDDRPRRRDDND